LVDQAPSLIVIPTKNCNFFNGGIIFTDGGTINPPGFKAYVTRGCSGKTFLTAEATPGPPYVSSSISKSVVMTKF